MADTQKLRRQYLPPGEGKGIDWREDEWFAAYHAERVTPAFAEWWLKFYGGPYEYEDSPDERHEYWVRCAFALHGWRARE